MNEQELCEGLLKKSHQEFMREQRNKLIRALVMFGLAVISYGLLYRFGLL